MRRLQELILAMKAQSKRLILCSLCVQKGLTTQRPLTDQVWLLQENPASSTVPPPPFGDSFALEQAWLKHSFGDGKYAELYTAVTEALEYDN